MTLLHATCVAIGDRAVLLTGPSGAGKSDLALRLIDRGAVLVSDDQVMLSVTDGRLWAAAPETIAGKLEVRGLGVIALTHRSPMPVSLLVELAAKVERMPEPRTQTLCGLSISAVALAPFEASAAIKVEWALKESKPLPFRGGVGVGPVRLVRSVNTPTPFPSPEGEGLTP